MAEPIRFIQIIAGPYYNSGSKLTHSVYGLSEHGAVYQLTKKGWVPVTSKVVEETSNDGAF